MALCEYIEYRMQKGEIVHLFENEDFRFGSRLVVQPSQAAVFVKDGRIKDVFEEGAYVLTADNLLFLSELMSKALLGTGNAFRCQVYFVNLTMQSGYKWGVPDICCQDVKYNMPITVGAHGDYSVVVKDPAAAMRNLFGTDAEVKRLDENFFNDFVRMHAPECLKKILKAKQLSVLDIDMNLIETAGSIRDGMNKEIAQLGLEFVSFTIQTKVNESDLAVIRKAAAAAMEQVTAEEAQKKIRESRGISWTEEQAAKNESILVKGIAAASAHGDMGAGANTPAYITGIAQNVPFVISGMQNGGMSERPQSAGDGSYCSRCGSFCPAGAVFCSACGNKLDASV